MASRLMTSGTLSECRRTFSAYGAVFEIHSDIPDLDAFLPDLTLPMGITGPTIGPSSLTKVFIQSKAPPHFGCESNRITSKKALRMGEGKCEIYAESNVIGVNFFEPDKKILRRILVAYLVNYLSFLGYHVLHGAAFALNEREAVLILGDSKAGKSTISSLWENGGGKVLCENYCLLDFLTRWSPFLDIRPPDSQAAKPGLMIRKVFILNPVEQGKIGELPAIGDYSVSNHFLDVFGVMDPGEKHAAARALEASLRRISGIVVDVLSYTKGIDLPETVLDRIVESVGNTR